MKKPLIVFLFAVFFIVKTFCQDTVPAFDKNYYMTKSKQQISTSWVIFGIGIGLAGVGLLVQAYNGLKHVATLGHEETNMTGAWIALSGGIIATASIPLHISGSINKKKALSLSLNTEEIFLPQNSSFISKMNFSISLRINLKYSTGSNQLRVDRN